MSADVENPWLIAMGVTGAFAAFLWWQSRRRAGAHEAIADCKNVYNRDIAVAHGVNVDEVE